jgi:hypothetical protein
MIRARHVSALAVSVLVLAALVAPGCGGATIEGVCSKCPNGSDICMKELTDSQAAAAKKGCEPQLQDVLDCADSKGVCDSGGVLSASDVCAQEILALSNCAG